jgi:hypothetical protein
VASNYETRLERLEQEITRPIEPRAVTYVHDNDTRPADWMEVSGQRFDRGTDEDVLDSGGARWSHWAWQAGMLSSSVMSARRPWWPEWTERLRTVQRDVPNLRLWVVVLQPNRCGLAAGTSSDDSF